VIVTLTTRQAPVGAIMLLGLVIHPTAQQPHQDVENEVSPCGSKSHGVEACVGEKHPCRVFHELCEAVDGGHSLVGGRIVA
jgi:hypothetical protein